MMKKSKRSREENDPICPLYIANIRKWNNRESRVIGRAAKVAKVVMNPVSKIGPIESPSIPNLQWKSKKLIHL
jgi:hypothetical protein